MGLMIEHFSDAIRAMIGPPPVTLEPPELTDEEHETLLRAFDRLYMGPPAKPIVIEFHEVPGAPIKYRMPLR